VRGNGDREVVTAFDEGRRFDPADPDIAGRNATWVAAQLSREERDFLAGFRDTVVLDVDGLGQTLFCHGSPRSDEEIMTLLTPEERLRELVAESDQRMVVCGHTHMQFDRAVDGTRILNAGSGGMPYQGAPGAFWLLLGPEVDFRRSDYEVDAFADRVAASGFPDDELAPLLRHPPGAEETAAFFEGIGPEPVIERD